MGRYSPIGRAEKAGRRIGGAVRRLTLRNGTATRLGHLPIVARVVLWTVSLVTVALLVVIAFWFALLVGALLAIAAVFARVSGSGGQSQPEWRQGLLGFGLYDDKGFRIDPHDPDAT